MTDEERDIITRFIQRVGGAAPGAPPGSLPPVDHEADRLIGELFAHYPEARYRLAQTAFVQEAAIKESQGRIRSLEADLQSTREALQSARSSQAQVPAQRSGFFSGGFQPMPPSPPPQANPWGAPAPAVAYPQQTAGYSQPPQYAPQAQPGMMPRQSSGFLGSALTTAAGVAGGVVAGNALMGLFSGHGGGMGGGMGGGFGQGASPVNETIINNYGDSAYPDQSGYPPPDPGYTPWGERPEASGSQALNDGYWSKDSIYQSETDGNDPNAPDLASNDLPEGSDVV